MRGLLIKLYRSHLLSVCGILRANQVNPIGICAIGSFAWGQLCPYSHWSQEFFATTNRKLLDLKVTSMCFAYHYIIDNSQWTFFCTWNVIHGSLFCRRHWDVCNLKRLDMKCITLVSSVKLVSSSVLEQRNTEYLKYTQKSCQKSTSAFHQHHQYKGLRGGAAGRNLMLHTHTHTHRKWSSNRLRAGDSH